ncbi:IMPACT family protein [Reinekea marinisedimentorum]|uniref:Putative YigZ family protein n=1 Tax=Reinekea marinisedimentorum TaxID=230495 RepID=A0A4R3IDZ8_9GAMM|nr:YigZ family protein [Reinekea marinisedimentorum]TCS43001.1 putative YigZ family protein [Reinekea marinisedimentorum]
MAVTLVAPVYSELEVKKSRFLTWVEPVASVDAAKARIAEIRHQYPDARHVCTAFYVKGNTGLSDDGEPSGTAAKPMFNVLNHKGLVDVVAIVVRYFGGIKLGAGGLSRAYGNAVSQTLDQAEYVAQESLWQVKLEFPFALESQVRHTLGQLRLELAFIDYQSAVMAGLSVKDSQKAMLEEALSMVAPGNPDFHFSVTPEG